MNISLYIKENQIELPEEIFKKLSNEDAEQIREDHNTKMFKLPESDIKFFEWLKNEDPKIWEDLWGEDDLSIKPYYVSTLFLPMIVDDADRGFPICDLVDNDNYFFTPKHMVDEESKVMIEVAHRKFKNKKRLTLQELLSLEISLGPIDIWHFAYKYNMKLQDCKDIVQKLVDDGALVHLKESEHLVPFIEF